MAITGISMFDAKDTKPELVALNTKIDDSIVTKIEALNEAPIDAELDAALTDTIEGSEPFDEDFLFTLKPDSRRNERIISFCMIYAADRFEYTVGLEGLMQNLRDSYSLEVSHNTFITTLVGGVLVNYQQLDEQVKPFLKNWKLERLGCCTRLILRMALWELRQEGAIPSIILNEAIELAKLFAERDAYKFVNGILDEVVKNVPAGIQQA